MKTSGKWLYAGAVIAALLQTGMLYAGIEMRARILRSGQEIELLTEPVDPRDLMRGDYVILGYAISSVERKNIMGRSAPDQRNVYVALKPGANGLWQFSRASFNPFGDIAADEVQIRGEADHVISDDPESTVRLDYGIERYYVPEGEGREIEDAQRERAVTVVVSVDKNGTAVIKSLKDKGKQLFQEPLY